MSNTTYEKGLGRDDALAAELFEASMGDTGAPGMFRGRKTPAYPILACVLAAVIAVASLVGCASQGGSASGAASATGSASSSQPSSSVSAASATEEIEDVTTIAYLGPAGTYTEEATKLFFGDNDQLMPQATVSEALAYVKDGAAAYAVIPQENTLGGPVTDYIDALLAANGTSVVGEVVLPIKQTLMGLQGTDLSQVKRVLSHKQGLAQSKAWLDQSLPSAERVEVASTAEAARQVSEGGDSTTVAIAAPGAASLYGLTVLQENVSQSEANKTRFYVVSRHKNERPGYSRAVFIASKPADDLPKSLEAACSNGAKLVCVHDRPEGSQLGMYRYVVELERDGRFTNEEIARIEDASKFECLGTFACVEG